MSESVRPLREAIRGPGAVQRALVPHGGSSSSFPGAVKWLPSPRGSGGDAGLPAQPLGLWKGCFGHLWSCCGCTGAAPCLPFTRAWRFLFSSYVVGMCGDGANDCGVSAER